jgi:hypothetical protein
MLPFRPGGARQLHHLRERKSSFDKLLRNSRSPFDRLRLIGCF